MDPSSGPQGRSLLDTLSLSTGAGLPVELQSAASATTMKVPFGFPSASVPSFHSQASTSGRSSPRGRSPRMTQEEKTSSRRSGRAIKRKKFDDEILVRSKVCKLVFYSCHLKCQLIQPKLQLRIRKYSYYIASLPYCHEHDPNQTRSLLLRC